MWNYHVIPQQCIVAVLSGKLGWRFWGGVSMPGMLSGVQRAHLIWKYFGSRMVVLAPDTGSVTTVSSSMSTSAWLATWAALACDVSQAYEEDPERRSTPHV